MTDGEIERDLLSSDGEHGGSPYAEILARRGTELREAVDELQAAAEGTLFPGAQEDPFPMLVNVFDEWPVRDAAKVVAALARRIREGHSVDLSQLARWARAHEADADAVTDCLSVLPPEGITILKLLSRAGSQKLVFLANWQIAQREVVVKRFISEVTRDRLLRRELQPHPLSMEHPNIIETHLLYNEVGEPFLVERRLGMVLNDEWSSRGLHEAANLLYDISSALAFLHDKQLIHGDIKPDNIGFEHDNYILLDFGICRPVGEFSDEVTPTGSLRTRAPELLLGEGHHSQASDVWALGATVFNAICQRFPLFARGEAPPRVSHPDDRAEFEGLLAERARNDWTRRVESALEVEIDHEPLRSLLRNALDRDPARRISASALNTECERQLAAFVRRSEEAGRFSPSEELDQLRRFLPRRETLLLMPSSEKLELKDRLSRLRASEGLSESDQTEISLLVELVSSS
jgi:serine/threonine protein kinase